VVEAFLDLCHQAPGRLDRVLGRPQDLTGELLFKERLNRGELVPQPGLGERPSMALSCFWSACFIPRVTGMATSA
jgi:hypothetical protein